MKRFALATLLALAVVAAAAFLWRSGCGVRSGGFYAGELFSGGLFREEIEEGTGETPSQLKVPPPLASGQGGPEGLVIPRPQGAREEQGERTPDTEATVSIPVSTSRSSGSDSSGSDSSGSESSASDSLEEETSREFVDLRIRSRSPLFPQFRRYRRSIEVDVVGRPEEMGAGEVIVAPQPRAFLQLQARFSIGAALSLGAVGAAAGGGSGSTMVGAGYVAFSPVRIWGLEPSWYAATNWKRLTAGPGVVIEVRDQLDVGGFWDIADKRPWIAVGYGFDL